jgi:hypothetical protein
MQKRKQFQQQLNVIPNQLHALAFPREMQVKMRYYIPVQYTMSGTVSDDNLYNLNSIFDPDRTLAGHQPLGYDQWSAFYGRYRVDSCKVTVHLQGTNGDGLNAVLLGSNSTTVITVPGDAVESPLSLHGCYSPGGPSVKLVKNFDLAILNGVTKATYKNDDRYQAIMGANPTETIILHYIVYDITLAAKTLRSDILLEYTVTMFDPVQLSQS